MKSLFGFDSFSLCHSLSSFWPTSFRLPSMRVTYFVNGPVGGWKMQVNGMFKLMNVFLPYRFIMRRSIFPAPIPLGTSGDITFFWLPQSFYHFFILDPALINQFKTFSIFQYPASLLLHTFFSDPGCMGGGCGQNNLTGAICQYELLLLRFHS